jgi:hypothetical protein
MMRFQNELAPVITTLIELQHREQLAPTGALFPRMMIVVSPGGRGGASRKNKRANNKLTSAANTSTSTTTTSTDVIHAVDGSMTTGLNMCFLIFSNVVLAPPKPL